MYEYLDDNVLGELHEAILQRKEFVSPQGVHAVKVSDGKAVYSVMNVETLINDAQVLEVGPGGSLYEHSNVAYLLTRFVGGIIPDPPEIWEGGFGWVASRGYIDIEEIKHRFPLRISLKDRRVLNEIDPEAYTRALIVKPWTPTSLGFIAADLERIWEKGYVVPPDVQVIVRRRTMARMRDRDSLRYDAAVIALTMAVCAVLGRYKGKWLEAFAKAVKKEGSFAACFYKYSKGLALPDNHIVKELMGIAEAELVGRRLAGNPDYECSHYPQQVRKQELDDLEPF